MANNHVADYKVRYEECPECLGAKVIYIKDKDDLRELLNAYDLTRQEIKQLLMNLAIDCPKCKGVGRIEIWY